MNLRQARKYFERNYQKLTRLFYEQYGDLPCGGWKNPRVSCVLDDDTIEIHCHYDMLDTKDESWEYLFNMKTEQFYP